LLTIITAHYNFGKAIDVLHDALCRQSNTNFEWLIVDDCSTPEEFAKLTQAVSDSPLKVRIYKTEKNSGPGAARNIGIENGNGEYLTFVDSDDLVSCDFVKEIDLHTKMRQPDILLFDFYRVNGKKRKHCSKVSNANSGAISKEHFLIDARSAVWGAAYKCSTILQHGVVFPNLYRKEDWVFGVSAALCSTDIWYVKKPLYHYINVPTSIVNSGRHLNPNNSKAAFALVAQLLENYSDELLQFLYAREVIYSFAKNLVYLDSKIYRESLDALQQKYPQWHKNKLLRRLPLHQRAILRLVRFKCYRIIRGTLALIK
jgi:glycosyltransferase involved in cell wall biosynthesis